MEEDTNVSCSPRIQVDQNLQVSFNFFPVVIPTNSLIQRYAYWT
jgi:hypothetical protein